MIDTNVAISALLWGGQPRKLLELADDPTVLQLFSSPVLLGELKRVLGYPKLQRRLQATGSNAASLLFAFRSIITLVEPAMVPKIVERDPDDNHVVAAAVTAQADAIVSGDDDLLALSEVAGVAVLRVSEAITLFT